MKRDAAVSIAKAIAIVMMVAYHAGCPSWMGRFFGEFIMPLFFVTSGYFFSEKNVADWGTFVAKRVRGLYWPMVKWSVVFLVLHNLWFSIGLLNEVCGNADGGVLHPYSWHTFCQRLWNIVTAMSGYDEFLCGAFWFFRALFVASIAYVAAYKLFAHILHRLNLNPKPWHIALTVCLAAYGLSIWKTGEGLKVTTLVQGGYRDLMGVFFFGCGYLWRLFNDRLRPSVVATVVCFAVPAAFSVYAPAGMDWRGTLSGCLSLPLPALCGVAAIYNTSHWIAQRETWAKRALTFCGDNTLYILVFHFLSFKLVSLLKIWYYDLPITHIGSHPVVHEHADDLFWIAYTVAGVVLPLVALWAIRNFKFRGFGKFLA